MLRFVIVAACAIAALCPAFGEGETDPVKAAKLVRPDEFFQAAT